MTPDQDPCNPDDIRLRTVRMTTEWPRPTSATTRFQPPSCRTSSAPFTVRCWLSAEPDAGAPSRPTPAVPIKKSVTPDYIVCLEDGKKLKMLKRHLRTTYGMTPEEYRREVGPAAGLSDGGAELRRAALRLRQEDRPGRIAGASAAAPAPEGHGSTRSARRRQSCRRVTGGVVATTKKARHAAAGPFSFQA